MPAATRPAAKKRLIAKRLAIGGSDAALLRDSIDLGTDADSVTSDLICVPMVVRSGISSAGGSDYGSSCYSSDEGSRYTGWVGQPVGIAPAPLPPSSPLLCTPLTAQPHMGHCMTSAQC